MKKAKEQSLRKKTIRTFIIMVIMLIPVSLYMILGGMRLARDRDNIQLKLKKDALAELVSNENEMYNAAIEAFDQNLAAHMTMMRISLSQLVSQEGYTGPRVLSDGFVAELRGNEVIPPEGMPEGQFQLSRSVIERSLASGKLRTGHFTVTEAPADDVSLLSDTENAATDDVVHYEPGKYFLSFAKITDNLVYVNMVSESMLDDAINSYVPRNYNALEDENGGFGGITLLVGEQGQNVTLLKAYGDADARETLSDFGITPDQILSRATLLTVDKSTYSCNYSTIQGSWDSWENPVMIQLLPVVSIGARSAVQSSIIGYAMALVLVNIIVYVMSVQRHVRENVISGAQAARYAPDRLRKRILNAAIISTISIFIIALIIQGVGQLYIELSYGQDTLRVISKQLEQADHRQNEGIQRVQEDWYVYYGEHMASLLTAYPELATPGMLQAYCDILNVDFIMLFDDQGKETLCNRDYTGFTLDRGLGQKSSEFRRLLYGLPSIVHQASTDSITGMERQMIGVKLPSTGFEGQHGALILALLPEQTKQTEDLFHINEKLAQFAKNGTLCFNVDALTGIIQYAGDASMMGRPIEEYGLNEKSLRDGYMDFGVVNGVNRFIVTSKQGGYVFYYALDLRTMFDGILLFAGIAAALFAIALVVVLIDLFKDYNDEVYAKWATVYMPGEDSGAQRVREMEMALTGERQDDGNTGKKSGIIPKIIEKLSNATHWQTRTPEDKIDLVFKVSLLVLMIAWASLLLSKNLVYKNYDSLAGFLLQGDWMRGLNPFSFTSILMVIAYAYLINLASHVILLMISGFLLGKGQTFCRLLHSFIKYFSLFVVLYLILHYLGFPIGTVVGSLSIASLALSLGAKDLAADVLAGLSIVFERTFQVGDIVEINGRRGTVQEIGVRTTKLIVPVNNVLVISNHQINDILNLSQDVSQYKIELKVILSGSLTHVEEVLRRELEPIRKRNDRIITLSYLGVTSLGGGYAMTAPSTVTLAIGAYCRQSDMYDVSLYLNREIKLLCEREGITII